MRVWADLTNTAHVLVLRPLVELLEDRGHEVTLTARPLSHTIELLDDWAQESPTLVVLAPEESAAAKSFRNLTRVAVLRAADVGVTDLLAAASLLVSEAALSELTARAAKPARDGAAEVKP